MAITITKKYIHYEYYLAIEDDLKQLSRFIDFHEENFNVFSIELSRILQITCSEIDVIFKLICNKINPTKKHDNIKHYKETILDYLSQIIDEKVFSSRYGLELNPFINWNEINKHPDWWNSYQLVKHFRNDNFYEANLKNVLNSVSALFILVSYYYLLDGNYKNDDSGFREMFLKLKNELGETKIFLFNENRYFHSLVFPFSKV